MPETMTGGRALAELWRGYGVTHVFFVDAILRRALVEAEAVGIARVLAHTEKAAAYMADGYARASGRVGVCLAQSVGAANLASGLQDAYLAGSPVVAITGRHPSRRQHRNVYQELDHDRLFGAVTKLHATIETVEELPFLVRQAFREAATGTPRPVHLDIVDHTGDRTAAASAPLDVTADAIYGAVPPHRPLPEPAALARAARALAGAERPVIVADRGAIVAGAGDAVLALARAIDAAIVTSLDAKGLVPEGDERFGGIVGTYGTSSANRIVAEADAVVFAGSNTGDMTTGAWRLPRPGTCAVVQIDLDPVELGRNHPGAHGLQCDVAAGLLALADACPATTRPDWRARVRAHVEEWRAVCDAQPAADAPIWPSTLCRALGAALPEDALVVSDTGYSAQWSGSFIDLPHAGQGYLRAAGSLGWALPAALGAKCAVPGRPVVVFAGDGALYYHLLELETARRRGLDVVVVVNDNGGLAQGQRGIAAAYEGREGRREDLYAFGDVSFERLARELECHGATVRDARDLRGALDEALGCGRPAVIDVRTPYAAMPPDPWLPA